MKKVLFVATVVKGHIDVFHLPYLKLFKDQGWETTVIAKNNFENKSECVIPYCDNYIDLPFERNPFKVNNLKSLFMLKKIIKKEEFDIIHCHTPVGGVIARLAAKGQSNAKIIYTAHGFHFFKGAPLKNWMLFYPVEKYLSKFTDVLITMNTEDFELVNDKFHPQKSILIPGVGVNLEKFNNKGDVNKSILRQKNNLLENKFILIYVGELSDRKNQKQLIEVGNLLKNKIKNLKILIVGMGSRREELEKIVKEYGLTEIVEFLGYRSDISELMTLSDIVVSTSKQEGLPVNLLEGLAVGKPIIATSCRGNRDLVFEGYNGFLSEINDAKKMADDVLKLYNNELMYKENSKNSLELSQKYDIENILSIIQKVYFE
ncbi:glycosyltransferase family 4 protein [Vagococcus fluvialis]|uniref:glycosyltransferase family 4 protein n=1 Tax=Vagococcus fluvialis TaxID=2738 RepID=UPI001A8FA93D|nr:glycosyltransferase family 4 protein [Vagococcus fluvialis]MBO0437906.1 glycosyltransferase family 4 protein [Vagococcus fluvialis]